jgi:hypothetical protein
MTGKMPVTTKSFSFTAIIFENRSNSAFLCALGDLCGEINILQAPGSRVRNA